MLGAGVPEGLGERGFWEESDRPAFAARSAGGRALACGGPENWRHHRPCVGLRTRPLPALSLSALSV